MKKTFKTLSYTLLAVSLFCASSAYAAGGSISKNAVSGEPDGQILTDVTTYAGSGNYNVDNKDALKSAFRSPSSLLVQADGSVLVSDSANQQIRKIAGGKVSVFAGASLPNPKTGIPDGGFLDKSADLSFFDNPAGIAADTKGNIYVADTLNNAVRKIGTDGTVTTLAGDGTNGNKDGKGKDARFYNPIDLAVAADGTVYVADTLNHAIRKIAADGTVNTLNAVSSRSIETKPGSVQPAGDFKDGELSKALFNEPSGLAFDAKGNLYVSDTGNQRIRYIDLSAGTVTTAAGSSMAADGKSLYEKNELYAAGDFADGDASKSLFNAPLGLAVTEEGGLLIADSLNNSVRYLLNGKVSTLAGDSNQFAGDADGADRSAGLRKPTDVAVAADGSILVTDSFNNKVRAIRGYSLPADLPADNDVIKVLNNSKLIKFEVQPELSNGRTMVGVRAITESFGYTVEFVQEGQIIRLKKGGVTIEMAAGSKTVTRKEAGRADAKTEMDAAPYIKAGNTLVPVRFFAEVAGMNVQWNGEHQTVIIR